MKASGWVLEVASDVAHVIAWALDEAEDHSPVEQEDETEHAFKSYHTLCRHLVLAHQDFFVDELSSLDEQTRKDHDDAHEDCSGGLLVTVSGFRTLNDRGDADKHEADNAHEDAQEVMGVDITLEEDLGEQASEGNHSSSKHLVPGLPKATLKQG